MKLQYPENLISDMQEWVPVQGLSRPLNQDQIKGLEYAISTLNEKEKFVLRLNYKEGKTYREIGSCLGVSGERVRQIKMCALRKLKMPSKSKYFKYGTKAYIEQGELIFLDDLLRKIVHSSQSLIGFSEPYSREQLKLVKRSLRVLTSKEKLIIQRKYYENKGFTDIGKELKVAGYQVIQFIDCIATKLSEDLLQQVL